MTSHSTAAPDAAMREALAELGLEPRLVSTNDAEAFEAWLQVAARGFLNQEDFDAEQVGSARGRFGYRRLRRGARPVRAGSEQPGRHDRRWIAGGSRCPGGRRHPHRRRSAQSRSHPRIRGRGVGIGRAMVEDAPAPRRLRGGAGWRCSRSSESTLYGRYGFGPAALGGVRWKVDTKRARWVGPVAQGRVDYISRDRAREMLPEACANTGEFVVRPRAAMPGGHWDLDRGDRTPTRRTPGKHRAVQYTDPAGEVRGVALYSVCAEQAMTSRRRRRPSPISSPRRLTPMRPSGASCCSCRSWAIQPPVGGRARGGG